MKSAYELAMERLSAKEGPVQKLTSEQKAQLAEIDSIYKAKIAERETFLTPKILEARSTSSFTDEDELTAQLHRDLATLREEQEAKKEKLRNSWK